MGAPLYTFSVPDAGAIRDAWLRTIRNGLIQRGVAQPNVTPGSDYYVLAQGFGNEAAIAMANAQVAVDGIMPDTAVGTQLYRIGAALGLAPRAASGSVGVIQFSASAASLVGVGAQLIDSNSLRYQVTVGGTYNNGDLIQIAAIDTGSTTNLASGSTLKWNSPPPFSAPGAVVFGTSGLINGVDAEGDEAFRQRVFARLQNFPASGNPAWVQSTTVQAHPAVANAAVYPAIQGPSSLHIAAWAAPTATYKGRDISASIMNGSVTPYIQGQLPTEVYSVVTTVANVAVTAAIGLSLPASPNASVPGPGGGWLDGTPWPQPPGGTDPCTVTVATSSTNITVNATTAPIAGASHVAWLSPITWTLYTATVTGFSGSSGAYVITLDTPFVGVGVGSVIFPQSQNQSNYVTALLAFFALMGPGEKSTNASALIRGYRHPTPNQGAPYSVGSQLLKALVNAGTEVLDASYFYRSDGVQPAITTASGNLTPPVPGTVTSAPNIYIPGQIGLFAL